MTRFSASFSHYHAHVYFDENSLSYAQQLRERVGKELGLAVGNFNTRPVGPHPKWSFEIDFTHGELELLVPWLEQYRQGLSVLVHPVTQDELKDHTDSALWLGEALSLSLEIFMDN